MNLDLYSGTMGQLVIVQFFVFWIWFKVMLEAIRTNDNSIINKRLVLTSIGLVLNSTAITGVMVFRIHELITGFWPFVWGVTVFYILMAAGGMCLIVAASLGTNARLLKAFVLVSVVWTIIVLYSSYFH